MEALPDRAVVSLRAQIGILDGFCRVFVPWREYGKGWEGTAVRLESELGRAERDLARRHAENLFSHTILSRLIFSTPFGGFEDNLNHQEDVLRKIDREGMNGYLNLLVAAMNQHWSPILTWEMLKGRLPGNGEYGEMDDLNGPSVAIVMGLLNAIESDGHIENRFRKRWNAFSPLHPFDTVRERMDVVLTRYRREYRLQSLL
jgi:hypothetical protein